MMEALVGNLAALEGTSQLDVRHRYYDIVVSEIGQTAREQRPPPYFI